MAKFAEAFGGPAFGAPAAAGAQHNITVNACCDEIGTHSLTIGFVYLQLYWAYRGLCAGPQRQFAILIGDVSGARGHAIGVEDWHSKFTDGFGREADSLGDPSQEWEECGFPEALIVDGGIPALGADFRDGLADACEIAGIDRPDLGGEAAAGDKIHPAGVR